MSLVAYISYIPRVTPPQLSRVDSFFYPVPTPSPKRTGFCVDLATRKQNGFDRVWDVFNSGGAIRK